MLRSSKATDTLTSIEVPLPLAAALEVDTKGFALDASNSSQWAPYDIFEELSAQVAVLVYLRRGKRGFLACHRASRPRTPQGFHGCLHTQLYMVQIAKISVARRELRSR